MTTIVAAAGGGNWTAGATWVGGVAPTAADNAQLGVTSGNIVIDTGAVARSLDCTGYVGTLTHNAVNLSLGDATAGAGNVALKLVAGMTYTLGSVTSSAIAFVSTSATQQTITSAGKTRGNTTYSGVGSSYLLTDATTIDATATWTLSAGTFNSGNQAMSLGLMVISGATAKTLTLGSSATSITGNAGTTVNYSGSNATFTANTAVMTMTGLSSGIAGAANWNGLSVVFASTVADARIWNVATFNNVTYTGGAIKTGLLRAYSSFTATGTLTVTGNSTINRVIMQSDVVGTARTVTAAAVSFSNVDFQDVVAAGAIPWTGTSLGNALGNSQITFDPSVTQTRNGADGNWSDLARWTSRVPLPQDNVVIDAGSSGTITMDMPRLGADVTFTGFAGTATLGIAATSYGSLVLGAGMTPSGGFTWTLGGRSVKTITNNGRTVTWPISIVAPGGTYTLTDAFSSSRSGADAFNVSSGTFNDGGNTVLLSGAAATSNVFAATLIATGVWTFNGVSFIVNAAATVTASAMTFIFSGASATARTFGGGGKTYGTLTYTVPGSTGSLTLTGSNTFNTINFSDPTNARSLLLTAATTTTVTNWNVRGTAGKLMTVDSATAATHTLSKASGVASSDYLSVKNSLAGGGAAWYAGANSTDAGGNTGWQFTAAPSSAATFGGGSSGIRVNDAGATSVSLHSRTARRMARR